MWESGSRIVFCPHAEITHLGGQSVGRFQIRFALETYRSGYRYFYKHYGRDVLYRIRRIYLLHFLLRLAGYGFVRAVKRSEALENRLKLYRVALKLHTRLDPVRFIETGEEPDLGYAPLAPAPKMTSSPPENCPSVLAHN